jgi:hypothetical protein
MTLDEMIKQIDNECSYPEALQIIRALRAAEEMRQAPIYDLKGDPTLMFIIPARRKWDAATGDDK